MSATKSLAGLFLSTALAAVTVTLSASAQTTVMHPAPDGAARLTDMQSTPLTHTAPTYSSVPFLDYASAAPHTASSDSPQVGLKLHGHWNIDIKNPDGSLAEHREIDNALSSSGASLLVGMMGGYFTAGDWMVTTSPTTGSLNPCPGSTYAFCAMATNLASSPATSYCSIYNCVAGLTATTNFGTNFAGPYSFVLSGNYTATAAGNVSFLQTIYNSCAASSPGNPITNPTALSNVLPTACQANTGQWVGPLATVTLASPVSVVANQIVQVTVTITFS